MGRALPGIQLIAPSLAEIKLVYYYPGEEKLVSLDVLKLYRWKDVVRQEPVDVDPDRWADKGELTKLPEIPVVDGERAFRETSMDPVNPKIIAVPD